MDMFPLAPSLTLACALSILSLVSVRWFSQRIAHDRPVSPVMYHRLLLVSGGGQPGYDQSFARIGLGEPYDPSVEAVVATVDEPVSGRRMVVSTTQPGMRRCPLPSPVEQQPPSTVCVACLLSVIYCAAVHLYTSNFLQWAPPYSQVKGV